MSLWGSRASPFASAEQACRMYSRGLRQLACWTKSEYQRIAFMLSTCRTAPKGESRPRSRAKKSVRIPGGCRLAPVLRLPSVQAYAGASATYEPPDAASASRGASRRVRLERGEVSGVGLGEEVPVDPLIALLLCLQQHPPSDLATGAPERVCTCPSHSSTGAPDTSTSSTVPGIVQSRAGALRADVVVVPVAAALSAAVGSVGLVVGLFWDGDPVLQPALRRY
eukprot:tig00020528_g9993.t1